MRDFWLMTWQQKSCVIVMLTKITERGVKKADTYWPKSQGSTCSFGDLVVVNKGSMRMTGITISFLDLHRQGYEGNRQVYHLHYTEWPDNGVPDSTLVLRSLLTCTDLYASLASSKEFNGPVICHCSAGIGRTVSSIPNYSPKFPFFFCLPNSLYWLTHFLFFSNFQTGDFHSDRFGDFGVECAGREAERE